ncbi:MAG TPA: hypothetical protein VMT87_13235 [Vicinamibacteria bacterium]|nr:hypothetical protein [Vicinamibacteria bacterium]
MNAQIRAIVEHLRSLQVLPAKMVPPAPPGPRFDSKGGAER